MIETAGGIILAAFILIFGEAIIMLAFGLIRVIVGYTGVPILGAIIGMSIGLALDPEYPTAFLPCVGAGLLTGIAVNIKLLIRWKWIKP